MHIELEFMTSFFKFSMVINVQSHMTKMMKSAIPTIYRRSMWKLLFQNKHRYHEKEKKSNDQQIKY